MKTVTLDSLRKAPALLDSVAGGEELLVTHFGKPYVRIVPASKAHTFLGAGKHLGITRPVSPDPVLRDAKRYCVEYYPFRPARAQR